MKKIFIISSLIAVTLATPSFAEPTEQDKKTVASKAYVDTKQDIIPAKALSISIDNTTWPIQSLVLYPNAHNGDTDGVIGEIGILTNRDLERYEVFLDSNIDCSHTLAPLCYADAYYTFFTDYDSLEQGLIPTMGSIAQYVSSYTESGFQHKMLPAGVLEISGAVVNIDPKDASFSTDPMVLGGSIVTKLDQQFYNRGVYTAERKIFESTDVANYHSQTLTNNEHKYQDVSIPTVGAMMDMISNVVDKLSWTATETTATKKYSTTFDGTANNWPAADANKLVDGTALANGLAQKQNKMVCAGWDSDTHTDEHCWLWSIAE